MAGKNAYKSVDGATRTRNVMYNVSILLNANSKKKQDSPSKIQDGDLNYKTFTYNKTSLHFVHCFLTYIYGSYMESNFADFILMLPCFSCMIF